MREPGSAPAAEDYLRLAMAASAPHEAAQVAREGLDRHDQPDPETAVLLLREVFKAHVHAGRVRSAHAVARKMVAVGALAELSYADLGRAASALGWHASAAQAWRTAARYAPARRRAMHWASCAAALHRAGHAKDALAALERAERWSTHSRPLHRAHGALLRMYGGELPNDLAVLVSDLEGSRVKHGYGEFVLGMIAHTQRDRSRARPLLVAFVKRNAVDPMRAATLAAELGEARRALRAMR